MCKCKLMVLYWRCSYVPSILCIHRYSCLLKLSHETVSNNARTAKYLCPLFYSWYGGDLPKAFLRSFWGTHSISTVYLADVICWFLMFWLERLPNSVFTYSKYSNDNLPDLKMQFDVFQNYSWTPNQVWDFFAWLSCQTCGLYIRILF